MNTEIDRVLNKMIKKGSTKRNVLLIILIVEVIAMAIATCSVLLDIEAGMALKVAMISMMISLVSVCMDIIKNNQKFIVHKIENDVKLDQLTTRIQSDAKEKGFDIDDIMFFEHDSEMYLKIYF